MPTIELCSLAAAARTSARRELLAITASYRRCLTVSDGNLPAERLYRSCGFEVWGREPQAIIVGGRPVAKLHMIHMLAAPGDGADSVISATGQP
jgi:hypothetical protein